MKKITITPKQFEKTNRALSKLFHMEYQEIEYETTFFHANVCGYGGATKGTTGYKYTDKQKENISNSLKGNKCFLGKKHSDETKQKLSVLRKGKSWTEEQRSKLMVARKKQRHSEETKQKMREIALKREELKRQARGN